MESSLMISSAFIYSLQNLSVKLAGQAFSFWWVVFFRGIIGGLVACALWLYTRKPAILHSTDNAYLYFVMRALLGGITIITLFYALLLCTMSQVVVMTSTTSFWMAIADYVLDGVVWSIYEWLALSLGTAGIIVIAYDNILGNWFGLLLALVSAFSQTGVNICIRRLRSENSFLITTWGMMGSVVLSAIGIAVRHPVMLMTTRKYKAILSLFSTGLLSMLAQLLKTISLQGTDSSSVIVLRYLDILFSIMWDVIIFHTFPTYNVYIGGALIISGSVLILCKKK